VAVNKTSAGGDVYCVLRNNKRAKDNTIAVYTAKREYVSIDDAIAGAIRGAARGEDLSLYRVSGSSAGQEALIASWKKETFHSGESWGDGWTEKDEYTCVHDLGKQSIDCIVEGLLAHPPVDGATLTSIAFGSRVPYWSTERSRRNNGDCHD
jgi:hypothetical protein